MKRTVILHQEGVPNPEAMKFVVENGILSDEPYEFGTLAEAEHSPLARMLLMLRYVERVYINRNYVTILKKQFNSPAWEDIQIELRMFIQSHLEDDQPIMYLGAESIQHVSHENPVTEMIKDLLDRQIRPAAQEDGGDIVFDSYENGVLNLSMHGSCVHCPQVNQTLKQGVEMLMKHYIPEVRKVTAVANGVV